nr:hypothetical protein [Amycolatopsis regifaucium]
MKDDAAEDDLGAVIGGSFGVTGCQAPEYLEPVEAPLDHVAKLVKVGVKAGGLPPALPLALRRAIWSSRPG